MYTYNIKVSDINITINAKNEQSVISKLVKLGVIKYGIIKEIIKNVTSEIYVCEVSIADNIHICLMERIH